MLAELAHDHAAKVPSVGLCGVLYPTGECDSIHALDPIQVPGALAGVNGSYGVSANRNKNGIRSSGSSTSSPTRGGYRGKQRVCVPGQSPSGPCTAPAYFASRRGQALASSSSSVGSTD
ncbi:hypothetical protein MSAN_01507800 [Mycena sanguinolenta]|uniref:Uncharacterized protein n=1 Tax=Mycena sanguinolenta TaxID=230812 RepID=A0A8H7CZ27_9AGAR|nr:hypothetical protein MSAN_01507800 [Mycena sanguinolenta]